MSNNRYYHEDYRIPVDVDVLEEIGNPVIEGSGGSCFPAGTFVLIAGGFTPIENVRVGDPIIAYDRYGYVEHGYVTVCHKHEEFSEDLYFVYAGEVSLFPKGVTGNHAIYDSSTQEHKEIKDFSIGESLVDLDGISHEITSIEIIENSIIEDKPVVYNLTVEPQHTYFVGDGTTFIRVHNGGGSKAASSASSAPYPESPNTLASITYARILEVVSHGEVEDVAVGDGKGVYLNGTAVLGPAGGEQIKGVTTKFRKGTPGQTYIEGFETTEIEVSSLGGGNGVLVTKATPVTFALPDPDIDSARITLRFPSGLYVMNKVVGAVVGASISFRIWTRPSGGSYTLIIDRTIQGKTTSPWEVDFVVPAPAGASLWDVKVQRLTDDDVDINASSEGKLASTSTFIFQRITERINGKHAYPNIALAAIEVDAKSVGNAIPTRSYLCKGIKVKVPDIFNPVTRTYQAGTFWDTVTFKTAWTDDPAWVLRDLITNDEYGLADYFGAGLDVDDLAFYEASMYNNCLTWTGSGYSNIGVDGLPLIPDGFGGREVRYRFNTVIATQQDAWQLLQSVASNMRAIVVTNGSMISIVQDRPKNVKRIFNTSNVIDGLFVYSSTDASQRATAIHCTFNDKNERYLPKTIVEKDQPGINKLGYQPKDIVAYACVHESQARRMAKWMLYTEQTQSDIISFSTGLNVSDLSPGDVIATLDDFKITDGTYFLTGRISSISGTTVNLGNSIKLKSGRTYTLQVMGLDYETIHTRTVTTGAGTWSTLSVSVAFSAGDYSNREFYCYAVGHEEPRQMLIQTISESSKGIHAISGIVYDSSKYAYIETGLSLTPRVYETPLPTFVPPVFNITVTEIYTNDDIVGNNYLDVRWDWNEDRGMKGAVTFTLKWNRDNGDYKIINNILTKDYAIKDTTPGVYNIIIIAEALQGKQSIPVFYTYNHRTNAGTSTLSPPIEFYVQGTTGTAFTGRHIAVTWKFNPLNLEAKDTLMDYLLESWTIDGQTRLGSFTVKPKTEKFLENGVTENPFYRGGKFNYTYEQNQNDYGSASRNVMLKVYSRDMIGDLSLPVVKTFSNPVPAVPSFHVISGIDTVYIDITPGEIGSGGGGGELPVVDFEWDTDSAHGWDAGSWKATDTPGTSLAFQWNAGALHSWNVGKWS